MGSCSVNGFGFNDFVRHSTDHQVSCRAGQRAPCHGFAADLAVTNGNPVSAAPADARVVEAQMVAAYVPVVQAEPVANGRVVPAELVAPGNRLGVESKPVN